ncbi:hypothetical protein P280DRAFT_519366 [Massarina eburnea CBS 473.64]|uniref:Uncharacterized protein n=1 Tax=Massarina eburnea CBS 473.64 TaxID=1395130 RepID=A0A6A6RVI0_9PLEO|nr:hypothetical protein P280DRAFT_519366 [Massarina eburnea CBS 473.64]
MSDRQPLIYDPNTPNTNPPVLPSFGFNASPVSPPSSPQLSRPGYTRLQSDTPSTVLEEDEGDIADGFAGGRPSSLPPAPIRRVSTQTSRRPLHMRASSLAQSLSSPSTQSPQTLSPPNTGDPFLGGFPRESAESTPDLRRDRFSPRIDGGGFEEFRRAGFKKSSTSLNDDYQQYIHSTHTHRLRKGAPSIKSAYETAFRPTQECPTARDFYQPQFTWVSVTIVILCLFSTIFSGIFLGLALKAPRYGRHITSQGSFQPARANLLTSVMAKLIELSFVTSFVAFLGQVLSRRAFMKEQGRGVTLSELSMWRWVVQPGTLITHWETALYAGLSTLGILSLLSAVLATLYTPAATALVQPILKQGNWDRFPLVGNVKTQFANKDYVATICETPITTGMDKDYAGNTCLQIEHAGQGYHNYQRYLSFWKTVSGNGNGTSDQTKRPPGFGLLHENTTVIPQWINIIDTKKESKKHGRAINSVSLAFPHSGVFAAARDPRNNIMQPEELNSEGTYSIRASVPSPVVNVYCANMNREELAPIVYNEWPNNITVDIHNWEELSAANGTTRNNTVVDELFEWTKNDTNTMIDYPPVFARIPKAFNTIMNHTGPWSRGAIYFLGSGGPMNDGNNLNGTYTLCKMWASLTAKCTTRYNATGSGGTMEALCEDRGDDMAFNKSNATATENVRQNNWKDVAFDWANSMSLNTGIMDADASNSRLLTQLILHNDTAGDIDLNPALPSPAEALAVMSGCTLLTSSIDAPFTMDWNYTKAALDTYQTQVFNASVRSQQYASGGADSASKGWMIILLLVFLMNIFVLIYFLFHRGLVTDFSEPPNLFALAVNSPPSHLLAGSCGGGPEGKQYVVNWFVNTEGDHLYMEPGAKPVVHDHHGHHHGHGHDDAGFVHGHNHSHAHPHPHNHAHARRGSTPWFSAATNTFNALRRRGLGFGSEAGKERLRPVSFVEEEAVELHGGGSKTKKTYDKLAKRTSML